MLCFAAEEYRWVKFDVIYYEYGALVMLYDDPKKATRAYTILRDSSFDGKELLVIILPNIQVCRNLSVSTQPKLRMAFKNMQASCVAGTFFFVSPKQRP